MSKYKYISNNAFPYLDNEDVYEYENIFDYTQWGENTTLRIMHVPWDRDYSNVVIFNDKDARDEWASEHTISQYTLQTAINIQPDGTIKLPVPFDVLAKCNYIVVEFAYAPVEFEKTDRIGKIGYFIDNVMQQAPSTTQARVTLDYWYTFIYDIDITYLDLERGHAPLAATSADYYLANPIERNTYLLTPDVNFAPDDRNRIKQAAEWIANDSDILAVFACTGNTGSSYWGDVNNRNMQVPGIAAGPYFGIQSGYDYIAIAASDLNTFLIQVNEIRPHWLQTVQGMFFVPAKLVKFIGTISWPGFTVQINIIDTEQKQYNLIQLTKDNFDYEARYKNIAKLYTYPYCHLEITDESGNTSTVYVENTTGKIGIKAALNLIWPFVGMDIIPIGIGGAATDNTNFGWSGNRVFGRGGDWYNLIKRYNIPAFVVSQSQNDRAKFDRFFGNAQSTTALENAYTNTLASNQTSYNTTLASNQTGYNNALASNQTDFNNTTDQNYASNVQNFESDRNKIAFDTNTGVEYATDNFQLAAEVQNASRAISETIQGANAYLQSANNAIATTMGAGQALLSAATAGNPVGAATSLANSAFAGIATVSAMTNNLQYLGWVAAEQRSYFNAMYGGVSGTWDAENHYDLNSGAFSAASDESIVGRQTARTNDYNSEMSSKAQLHAGAISQTNRALINGGKGRTFFWEGYTTEEHDYTGTAVRSKATSDANALATKNTGDANALANKTTGDANAGRDRQTALAAIDNGNRNQGVAAPAIYGTNSSSDTASSRPMGLFVNIATQSKAAIKAAGDQFLRYGYVLEQAWTPEKLQVMKHFTYWKARDIWISGRGITIEDASEMIKNIFLKGTTVWSNPADVGNVSIYDNI